MKSRWAASLALTALWLLSLYPVKSHRKRFRTAARKAPAAHPCAPGVGWECLVPVLWGQRGGPVCVQDVGESLSACSRAGGTGSMGAGPTQVLLLGTCSTTPRS